MNVGMLERWMYKENKIKENVYALDLKDIVLGGINELV